MRAMHVAFMTAQASCVHSSRLASCVSRTFSPDIKGQQCYGDDMVRLKQPVHRS